MMNSTVRIAPDFRAPVFARPLRFGKRPGVYGGEKALDSVGGESKARTEGLK